MEEGRKPKNIGMGNLSLPQRIFLTQELNQGFLLCRWILHQLSYQGSPTLRAAQASLPCHSFPQLLGEKIAVQVHSPGPSPAYTS